MCLRQLLLPSKTFICVLSSRQAQLTVLAEVHQLPSLLHERALVPPELATSVDRCDQGLHLQEEVG